MTVLSLAPALLGAQRRGQDTRPGIAVLPFTDAGSVGQAKENFAALERGIAGMLISELARNPAARVVEREQVVQLVGGQQPGGRVDSATIIRVGKAAGARYVVVGTFRDFYGDFGVDARLVNAETGQTVKTESDRVQRDHLFDLLRTVAGRLMKDANLPQLERRASDERFERKIPTEALTYYSRALLYQDRGEKDKAADMYTQALTIFPEYAEAQEGLQRVKRS
jgi:TolB-like protein